MVALQIRDVPGPVRDRLAAAARAQGQSLQAYLLGVLEREAAGQENRRLLEKWAEQPLKGSDDIDFVELVRSERDAREQRLSRLAGVDSE